MQKLVISASIVFLVACSSKPKEAPTTASSVPAVPADPMVSGSDMGTTPGSAPQAGVAAGAGSAVESVGSTAATSANSAKDQASSAVGHTTAGATPAVAPAPAFDFDKLTREEKMDFMKKNVVPTMKPLFQEFDKKKYANFGCKTCHGKDPVKSKYKMPNPALGKLDFAKMKEGKLSPKEAQVAEWMGKVVKPEMAKLFQMPEYTETNPTGFGCLHCHVQKQ